MVNRAFLFFVLCWTAGRANILFGIDLQLFDFSATYPSPCENRPSECQTQTTLVEHALRFSYESREQLERLFQARKGAVEKIGNILPHLNFGSALSIADRNALIALSSGVGFLFPNRWFEWKAKRREMDAERESTKTLLANQAISVQMIYLSIQLQIWNIRILEHYISELEKIINELSFQKDLYKRDVSRESFAILENFIAKLKYDRANLDNLSAAYPALAQAIGLAIKKDDNEFILENMRIKSLKKYTRLEEASFVEQALNKSTEIKALEHMIEAARYDKKTNYFDFLDLDSKNDLGLGYGARIKISRSAINVLKIQKEKTISNVSLNVFWSINNYNDMLYACQATENGMTNMEYIRQGVNDHIKDVAVPLDITRVLRYLDIVTSTALRYSTSYFLFKMNKANLERYTWDGKNAQSVEKYIKNELEDQYIKVKKSHKLFRRKSKK